jgi:hypothetical protein
MTETVPSDIAESYSADRIQHGEIRSAFEWSGSLWVATGFSRNEIEAYRLLPLATFTGTSVSYGDRVGTLDGEQAARRDPKGFYDGVKVRHGGKEFVLAGPPARFVAEAQPVRPEAEPEPQISLFEP